MLRLYTTSRTCGKTEVLATSWDIQLNVPAAKNNKGVFRRLCVVTSSMDIKQGQHFRPERQERKAP